MTTPAPTTNPVKGILLAAAGSITFSGKSIIAKLAYRYDVDSVTLLMLRMAMALPLFLGMALWAGRGKAALTRKDVWGILCLGFTGYYLSSFLDFWGLEYISASLERLILYLNPTFVLLLGWVLYKRRITYRQMGAMVISYCGVLVVFGQELNVIGPHVLTGAALVFCSAMTYSVYMIYSGQMVKRLGALRLAGWATSVACLLCIGQFVLMRPLTLEGIAPQVLWLSLLNATVCTVLPVFLVMMAIERIGPALTAQTSMVGPLSTVTMGVLVLDEPFTAWIVAGTVLVLTGIFMVTRPVRA